MYVNELKQLLAEMPDDYIVMYRLDTMDTDVLVFDESRKVVKNDEFQDVIIPIFRNY